MKPQMDRTDLIASRAIELINELLAHEELNLRRGETTQRSLQMLKSRLVKHVLPWLIAHPIESLNFRVLCEFVEYLKTQDLSLGTVSQYLNALRRLMKFALSKELIDILPTFPSVKNNSTSRGGFTLTEYKKLVRIAP